MTSKRIERDERTVSVENASYRIAYLLMSYGLLLAIGIRSFSFKRQSWDLLALVVIGGVVAAGYQGWKGILTSRSGKLALASVVVAVAIAAGIALAL